MISEIRPHVIAITISCLTATAFAHNIDMEPQLEVDDPDARRYRDSHPANFSAAHPYDLTQLWPTRTEGVLEGQPRRVVDFEHGTPTWMGGIMTSRAIFGYLNGAPNAAAAGSTSWQNGGIDTDVYEFTVTPEDSAQMAHLATPRIVRDEHTGEVEIKRNTLAAIFAPMGVTLAMAQPIVPACEETRDDYPAIALTVPCSLMVVAGTDEPALAPYDPERNQQGDVRARTEFFGPVGELPFETQVRLSYVDQTGETRVILSAPSITQGTETIEMCVAQIAFNIPTDHRVVYFEEHTANTWFLPTHCTLSETGGPDCDGDAETGRPRAPGIFYPIPTYLPEHTTGRYYVWNPEGVRIDYTLNSGLGEGFPWVAEYEELEARIHSNTWTHQPCTQLFE